MSSNRPRNRSSKAAGRQHPFTAERDVADARRDRRHREHQRQADRGRDDPVVDLDRGADMIGVEPAALLLPAVPALVAALDHVDLRPTGQNSDVAGETLRQVDVVGIQKRDVGAACRSEAQIATGAHAEIGVAGVLEVAHARRMPGGKATRDRGAAVARAIIDQQQLPIADRSARTRSRSPPR